MRASDQTILIVEHDVPTRDLYARELRRRFQVLTFSDECEAFEALKHHSISLIILNLGVANERGWQLLHTLRNDIGTRRIPVVLCSTFDERKRGIDYGADAFFVKPVLPSTLLEIACQLLPSSPDLDRQ
jgi:DNA-binding response OmpR family regulator